MTALCMLLLSLATANLETAGLALPSWNGQTASSSQRAQSAIKDKTLVVWTAPSNLVQRGGSALTLEKPGGVFDAVVFGELAPAKWMAGSDSFSRTQSDQSKCVSETADRSQLVQLAIVYRADQIAIYRNGQEYARYKAASQVSFGTGARVLLGLRHNDAGPENRFFTGSIEDARIYDVSLNAQQIAALRPNQLSEPKPWAWWDFENGSASDSIGRFPAATLFGGARIADGRLQLNKVGAYMVASDESPTSGTSNQDEASRAVRERLLSDPYRPGYHFAIPEGQAMPFDPNGAIYWKGRYHLFYIFQDKRGHNWGHVSSADLFHWRHHPTGLVSGMFSGNCFINKDGVPTMCYHQVGQGNAMAVALDDDLNEWKKLDTNPITPHTKPGEPFHDKYRSWDPYGWLEGDTYYAIFGGETPGVVKSTSLGGPWSYVGNLMGKAVPGVSINEDVSCADFFKLGDKRMLLCISHRLGARYYLGEWKNEQFIPTFHERMSWVDNSFFAPESLVDAQGRRIMWAWILDSQGFQTRGDFGWSGTMSLPRVLSLASDGTLRMEPPKEIEALRSNERTAPSTDVASEKGTVLEGIAGNSLELHLEVAPTKAAQVGVKVCCSPDGREETVVYYDAREKKLKVDTTWSSLTEGPKTVEAGPLALKPNEPLRLRIFIDKSVVEVFANGRQSVMRRIYPSRKDSLGVRLFSKGGTARFAKIRAWDMSPSNPY